MARKKKDIFDAVKNVPRRNSINKKKGGRQGPGGGDPDITHYPGNPNIAGQGGEQLLGPWHQSGVEGWLDWLYSDAPGHASWGGPGGMGSNIADFSLSGYDNFYDWWNYWSNGYYGDATSSPSYAPNNAANFTIGTTASNPAYGGSMGGGVGDLGTGGTMAGGGMGTSQWGGGLWEQQCSQIGPQFNSAGECIACCEDPWQGTGFYGDPDYVAPDPNIGVIDPDIGGECLDMYQAAGGANSGIDYDTFEGLYC